MKAIIEEINKHKEKYNRCWTLEEQGKLILIHMTGSDVNIFDFQMLSKLYTEYNCLSAVNMNTKCILVWRN